MSVSVGTKRDVDFATLCALLGSMPWNMGNPLARPVASAPGVQRGKTRGVEATPLAHQPIVPHLLCVDLARLAFYEAAVSRRFAVPGAPRGCRGFFLGS